MRLLGVILGIAFVLYVGALIGIALMIFGAACLAFELGRYVVRLARATERNERLRSRGLRSDPFDGAPERVVASGSRTRRRDASD